MPFGDLLEVPGAQPARHGHFHTAHERGSESGLDYRLARYSSVTTYRFLSPDPVVRVMVHPGLMNGYSYVGASPMVFHDPDGRFRRPFHTEITNGAMGVVFGVDGSQPLFGQAVADVDLPLVLSALFAPWRHFSIFGSQIGSPDTYLAKATEALAAGSYMKAWNSLAAAVHKAQDLHGHDDTNFVMHAVDFLRGDNPDDRDLARKGPPAQADTMRILAAFNASLENEGITFQEFEARYLAQRDHWRAFDRRVDAIKNRSDNGSVYGDGSAATGGVYGPGALSGLQGSQSGYISGQNQRAMSPGASGPRIFHIRG